jgi:hypothetical protein
MKLKLSSQQNPEYPGSFLTDGIGVESFIWGPGRENSMVIPLKLYYL